MTKKFCLIFFVFTVLLCVFFESTLATAQDSRFRGTVKDEEGDPIPKAKLTLTLVARNLNFSFESNNKGKFYRRGIEPGDFLLNVEAKGFDPFQQEVYFSVGEEYTLDIILVKKLSEEEAKNTFLLGVQLYQEGKYDLAIENFEAVLKENPDFAEGYYNIGMAYLKKGDLDNAITQMSKAIELKPDFVQAYFGLGQVYMEKGEKKKATEVFQQAVDAAPGEASTYVNLGIFYFTNNEDDLALEALLKAKDINPSLPQTYYQLGLVYTRKGELDKTMECFEKFLELAPQAQEAATVKSLLEELKKK